MVEDLSLNGNHFSGLHAGGHDLYSDARRQEVIDLTNREGVWVEQDRENGTAHKKVQGLGSLQAYMAYDSSGKPRQMFQKGRK